VIALGSLASDADIKLFGVIDSFGFTAANMAEREDISFVGVAVDDTRVSASFDLSASSLRVESHGRASLRADAVQARR
jgi:hypothetical protein